MRLAQVVFDAVVTAQYHASYQSQHFLGFLIQGTILIGVGIKVPKALHNKIIFTQDHLVHFFPVIIKILY
jgi:hypothetical protein